MGGNSTKIHCIMSGDLSFIDIILSLGNQHDIVQAENLIEGKSCDSLIADKAYRSKDIVDKLTKENIEVVIPYKSNAKDKKEIDNEKYKERNCIERFFCDLKNFRGIATRYAKTAKNFFSSICFAVIILKKNKCRHTLYVYNNKEHSKGHL